MSGHGGRVQLVPNNFALSIDLREHHIARPNVLAHQAENVHVVGHQNQSFGLLGLGFIE